MKTLTTSFMAPFLYLLIGCSSVVDTVDSDPVTRTEAKAEACPIQILEADASPEDCSCIETALFKLGQDTGALRTDIGSIDEDFGAEDGKRKIAIGLLRHDAMEQCGLFDPDHIVSKNL